MNLPSAPGPIGIFDSGYGGLTILQGIRKAMPEYDYIFLGDNARAPYGTRSFDVVYEFTRQAVIQLFELGCHLIILGCNTASARALRSIQQQDLPHMDTRRRVLGIIRPTAEVIGTLTRNNHVGLLGTEGTIHSHSYNLEIHKFWPDIHITGVACPFWVPLVEYGEANSPGADYFVQDRLNHLMQLDPQIDTIILGCTHYPLMMPKIKQYSRPGIRLVPQGDFVASSLVDYLRRHPETDAQCTQTGTCRYYTTESPEKFKGGARIFLNENIPVQHLDLQ